MTPTEAAWRPGFSVFEAVAEVLSDVLDQTFLSSWPPTRVDTFGYAVDLAPALKRFLYTTLVNDRRILDGVQSTSRHDSFEVIRSNVHSLLRREIAPIPERFRRARCKATSVIRPTTDVLFVTGNARLSRFVAETAGGMADEGMKVLVMEDPRQAMRLGWRVSHVVCSQVERAAVAREILSLVESTLALLEASRPRVVGVVEGCKPVDAVVVECCKALGVPTVCLQQGWSPIIHAGFRDLRVSTMATWGEGFSELMRVKNPELDCTVIGSEVVTEGRRLACRTPVAELADWPRSVGFALGGENLFFDDHLLMDLVSGVARAFPTTDVVVRPHPAQMSAASALFSVSWPRNVSVVPPDAQRLSEFIGGSDVLVAGMSTTLLEASAVGVPAIAAGVPGLERIPPFDLATGRTSVDSVGDLIDLLFRIREDDSVAACDDHLREHYFACSTNPDPRRSAISAFARYVS